MFVKDVMTVSPILCDSNDSVEHVAKLMREHDCGFIPVSAGGKLVGVITDRDITTRVVASGRPASDLPVSDVMSRTISTVGQDENVQTAIDLMEARQVRRLPVTDAKGNVVGVVAPSDLAPIFASMNVADFLLAVSYWSRKPVPAG